MHVDCATPVALCTGPGGTRCEPVTNTGGAGAADSKGPQWAPEWATEQALISGACDIVLTWITQPLKPRIVRRLQLATQRGRTLAFLLRPWSARVAQEPSHALLRLGVEPQSNGNSSGVRLSILKSRGGATGQWWLDLDAAQAAGV